jgi:hypothetical protein
MALVATAAIRLRASNRSGPASQGAALSSNWYTMMDAAPSSTRPTGVNFSDANSATARANRLGANWATNALERVQGGALQVVFILPAPPLQLVSVHCTPAAGKDVTFRNALR